MSEGFQQQFWFQFKPYQSKNVSFLGLEAEVMQQKNYHSRSWSKERGHKAYFPSGEKRNKQNQTENCFQNSVLDFDPEVLTRFLGKKVRDLAPRIQVLNSAWKFLGSLDMPELVQGMCQSCLETAVLEILGQIPLCFSGKSLDVIHTCDPMPFQGRNVLFDENLF